MLRRIITVTVVLGIIGALAGVLGALVVTAIFAVVGGSAVVAHSFTWLVRTATLTGAAAGIVIGTSLTWFALRAAPVWRASGEPALAASVVAAVVLARQGSVPLALGFALLAALVAAARLKIAFRDRASVGRTQSARGGRDS